MPAIVAVPCAAAGGLRAWRRACVLALVLTAASLVTGCAWLDAQQSRLALRPTPGRPGGLPEDAQLFRPGDQRLVLQMPASASTPAGQVAVWWLPQADPQAPTLLYLHGTFRNLYQNLSKIDALRALGFAIVAVDYRGWGDSSVLVPSEETIAADARLAWDELLRHQADPARRVIFGHSMGGAVAVRLASTLHGGRDYAALALESTFTRLPAVAASAGFWGRVAAAFTTLEFDSLSRIQRIDAPILMLHGSADTTVPVALGRALRDAAPAGTRWVEIPGGSHSRLHSDAPAAYAQAFRGLVPALMPESPPQPSAR